MALVQVAGRFMGVSLDSREFQGVKKTSVLIDVYQKDSPLRDKSVQVKSDDLEVYKDFTMMEEGDTIALNCTVSAYKNDAYYKLHSIGV
ncbi:hypothetical protein [Paenibacillus sp. y28]|uniref:hypothetical protein n=1 Tax=Paenibacillus sp. y28 TaxID=3129110 RepID=UPI00301AD206